MRGAWMLAAGAVAVTPVATEEAGTGVPSSLHLGRVRDRLRDALTPPDPGPVLPASPADAQPVPPRTLFIPDVMNAEVERADRARRAALAPLPATSPPGAALAAFTALDGPASFSAAASDPTAVAHWLGRGARAAGLPAALPVMAALTESGLRNVPLGGGNLDSVGLFQMRLSVWDTGRYAGFAEDPDLQLAWFVDHALAVQRARIAAGRPDPAQRPEDWGDWVADVERPALVYRGRYQLHLPQAAALLEQPVSALGSGADLAPPPTLTAEPRPGAGRVARVLAARVLRSDRITLPPGAQADLREERIDPRVCGLLLAMAQRHTLAVSVFETGHPYLTAGGSVSNHSLGRAADVAVVDGRLVRAGNRAAKRAGLQTALLPAVLRPTEVGAPWLLDVAGAFTDEDHTDHLHLGFDDPPDAAQLRALDRLVRAPAPSPRRVAQRRRPRPVAPDADPTFTPVGAGRTHAHRTPFSASPAKETTP